MELHGQNALGSESYASTIPHYSIVSLPVTVQVQGLEALPIYTLALFKTLLASQRGLYESCWCVFSPHIYNGEDCSTHTLIGHCAQEVHGSSCVHGRCYWIFKRREHFKLD